MSLSCLSWPTISTRNIFCWYFAGFWPLTFCNDVRPLHVGPMFSILSHLGPVLVHVGPCGAYLGPCCAYVEAILGLCGPSSGQICELCGSFKNVQ